MKKLATILVPLLLLVIVVTVIGRGRDESPAPTWNPVPARELAIILNAGTLPIPISHWDNGIFRQGPAEQISLGHPEDDSHLSNTHGGSL